MLNLADSKELSPACELKQFLNPSRNFQQFTEPESVNVILISVFEITVLSRVIAVGKITFLIVA
jgi:hypothetical protein